MEGDDEVSSSNCAELDRSDMPRLSRPMALPQTVTGIGLLSDFVWFMWTIWSFFLIHWIGFKFTMIELCTRHKTFEITNAVVAANKGKWAVVTGGARGIGYEVVRKLYESKMNVIIGCRDIIRGHEMGCKLRKEFGFGRGEPSICVLRLDLNDIDSVESFAEHVQQVTEGRIHVLVNNAGVMFSKYTLSRNGCGSQMQINHLAHFALIYMLMPTLVKGGSEGRGARVVNVSSVAHFGSTATVESTTGSIMFRSNDYQIYMDSKFCQLLTSATWNDILEASDTPVRVFNVHPGIVNTALYKNVFYYKLVAPLFQLIYKTPRQGADCVVFAALSPTLDHNTPLFLTNCEEREPLQGVANPRIRERIWMETCLVMGIPSLLSSDGVEPSTGH